MALLAAVTMLGGLLATAAPASASHHGTAPAPVTCSEQLRPLLRAGSTHSCVASLQHFLGAIAFVSGDTRLYPGAVDAHFGSGTARAVRRFQELKGLAQDGQVGNNTWGAIAGDCAIFYARGAYNVCHTQVTF
jgi:peptidoglycan hydrolase-like protein with peptidoglycan-binding domain